MKGERPARLLLPSSGRATSARNGAVSARPTTAVARRPRHPAAALAPRAPVAHELDAAGTALFEALRRHRLEVARREGIAPFIVASDRTLRDIARLRPRTLDELQLAYGIGQQKAPAIRSGPARGGGERVGDSGGAANVVTDAAARPPAVALDGIAKKFGEYVALRDVTLSVDAGEFVCFLGPSGCGKTTLLRIIAGLERQNLGVVRMAGRDVSALPPKLRNYGIVFQSYALFPNLSVARNIAYGIEARKMSKADIDRRVDELLELMGLPRHKHKYPAQLSGGEQQRVALARALAPSPSLLLLDEPLSALDARVRQSLRREIRDLQRRLGVTTIMVTHDQEEALAMADRIVVMNHGVVEQVGTPVEVYMRPGSRFVARFVGQMNFISATACEEAGRVQVGDTILRYPAREASCRRNGRHDRGAAGGDPRRRGARPARTSSRRACSAVQFLGPFTRLLLSLPGRAGTVLECDVAAGAFAELRGCRGRRADPWAQARGAARVPSETRVSGRRDLGGRVRRAARMSIPDRTGGTPPGPRGRGALRRSSAIFGLLPRASSSSIRWRSWRGEAC